MSMSDDALRGLTNHARLHIVSDSLSDSLSKMQAFYQAVALGED